MLLLCAAAAFATVATASRCQVPMEVGQTIHPNGNTDLCLTTGYNKETTRWANVTVDTCNGSPYQVWTGLRPKTDGYQGSISVSLTGAPNDMLFASDNGNGEHITIAPNAKFMWGIYWTYSDGVLEHYGENGNMKGYCLDLTDGDTTPGTQVQTWQCYEGNPNQIWTVGPDIEVPAWSLP